MTDMDTDIEIRQIRHEFDVHIQVLIAEAATYRHNGNLPEAERTDRLRKAYEAVLADL